MFTRPLVLREDTIKPGQRWILHEPRAYEGLWDHFFVPDGFITDMASVPRLFWILIPPTGRYSKATVIHDWLYTSHQVSRKDADGIFRRILRESGVAKWRRFTMYWAVRLFGRRF